MTWTSWQILEKGHSNQRFSCGSCGSFCDLGQHRYVPLSFTYSLGGLDEHIKTLKEMVLFPLLYPELFESFHVMPPRGVLFCGPPGTGKTLMARALANSCSVVFHVLFVHSPRTVVPSPSSCEKERTACPNGWEKLSDNFEHCLNKPNSTNPPSFSLMKLMVLLLFEAANKYSSLPLPHWLGPNPFLYCLYAACSDGWSRF